MTVAKYAPFFRYSNTWKLVKKNSAAPVFFNLFSVLEILMDPDETIFFVFDVILSHVFDILLPDTGLQTWFL